MKKLCFSALIAFWSSLATLLAVNALATDPPVRGGDKVYTMEEVARHDSAESCWYAIEGKVYDVTDYVPRHPTPPTVLLPWCGKEATEGMRTKGFGRDHSSMAWDMLEEYRIGTLAEE